MKYIDKFTSHELEIADIWSEIINNDSDTNIDPTDSNAFKTPADECWEKFYKKIESRNFT